MGSIMIWRCLVAVVLLCLQLTTCTELSGSGVEVPEPVRIWSILNTLLRGGNDNILRSIYPIVTQLEEYESDSELHEDLVSSVARMLSTEFGRDDLGTLLPLYASLYPMGLSQSPINGSDRNYFVLNGEHYENSDDVYYLKSEELKRQAQKADYELISGNEVTIGINAEAPIVILYGCPDSEGVFEEFNRNLFAEATKTGKLRYVWRSTCSLKRSNIPGIPIALTPREESDPSVLSPRYLGIPEGFEGSPLNYSSLSAEELKELDLKVAALISNYFSETGNFHSTLQYAKGIINNFPLLVRHISTLDVDTHQVLESNQLLKKNGIDHNMLGLYVNGQNWRLSEMDSYNLINAITFDYFKLEQLQSLLQENGVKSTAVAAKHLLKTFSKLSLLSLQELQPIKVDLHRIPGFSESVIYFNDIETDAQYESLENDIQKFYEKSKFGELPECRQNWNEVIFVIDFARLDEENTKIALEGLNRAIKVITQGYPQRIGLLPLNTGNADGIVNKLYQLKDVDLLELEEFLDDIPGEGFISSRYKRTPNYSKISRDLQISTTSIIINGEIHQFKKNTWHYLIASVIKKDTARLKRELSRYINKDGRQQGTVDVRGLLHLKSSNTRHQKYAPDYFADATYTSMNNLALNPVKNRVLTYIKGENYVTLHTVTLFDDFNTPQGLKRLNNILSTGFAGVRIRLIHNGSLVSKIWRQLIKTLTEDNHVVKIPSLIKESSGNVLQRELGRDELTKWLIDLPQDSFDSDSFLVINGRFIHLDSDEIPSKNHFEAIIKREAKRTLDCVHSLDILLPAFSEGAIDPDFVEMFSATLTKLFYHSTQIYNNGIDYTPEGSLPRIDLSQHIKINNHTIIQSQNEADKSVDVNLFMDPTEERSQVLLSLVSLLEDLPFVNLQVVLLPTEDLKFMPIERIYFDGANDLKIKDELRKNFQVELQTPSNFFISNETGFAGVVIEVHAYQKGVPISEANVDGVGGVCLELVDSEENIAARCITMKTFGYGQFITETLGQEYSVRSCDSRFRVSAFASNGRSDYVSSESFVSTLDKVRVHVEVEEIHGEQDKKSDTNILNIYTILKDNDVDEQKCAKMIVSILRNAPKGRVAKFWILDQPYISRRFKKVCQKITEDKELPGTIEFVKYSWPLWLRPQRFSDKRMDLFKVMFVDVMFPHNISKVLFMEPNSKPINPFKLHDQIDQNSPFSMLEMTGSGYWEEGYWAKMLQEKGLPFYSTRPAFLINLDEIRKDGRGDNLRVHYQRLSADLNSLLHADQDLVNDLQSEVPISSLKHPEEWFEYEGKDVESWFKQELEEEEEEEEDKEDEGFTDDLENDLLHDEL